MIVPFWLLVALLLPLAAGQATTADGEDFCNICGPGNAIAFGTGVVTFIYEGEERTNNCDSWQEIVKNPVAISSDFCRNEMPRITAEPCRCYNELTGEATVDLYTPEPSTSSGEEAYTPSPFGAVTSPAPAPGASMAVPSTEAPTGSLSPVSNRCIGDDGMAIRGCVDVEDPTSTSGNRAANMMMTTAMMLCLLVAGGLVL